MQETKKKKKTSRTQSLPHSYLGKAKKNVKYHIIGTVGKSLLKLREAPYNSLIQLYANQKLQD